MPPRFDQLDPYELISERCTVPQIAALVRDAKQVAGSDLLIGSTKDEALQNLRRGVDAGFVQIGEVWQLLRSAEENGDQHIFLFRTKNRAARDATAAGIDIAQRLFGRSWQTKFPNFGIPSESIAWSDFRIDSHGWTGKLYGWDVFRKQVRESQRQQGSVTIEVVEYEVRRSRQVTLIRWTGSTLEIRVPRSKSRAKINQNVADAWNALSVAGLSKEMFTPLDLRRAKRGMVDASISGQADGFAAHEVRLTDSDGGIAEFKPATDDDEMSGEARDALSRSYKDSECRDLTIVFQPVDGLLEQDLRVTICGRDEHNEIVIASRTSPDVVSHVLATIHRLI